MISATDLGLPFLRIVRPTVIEDISRVGSKQHNLRLVPRTGAMDPAMNLGFSVRIAAHIPRKDNRGEKTTPVTEAW